MIRDFLKVWGKSGRELPWGLTGRLDVSPLSAGINMKSYKSWDDKTHMQLPSMPRYFDLENKHAYFKTSLLRE